MHRNAPTDAGWSTAGSASGSKAGWPVAHAAAAWGSRGTGPMSGGAATRAKGSPASKIVPAGLTVVPARPRPALERRIVTLRQKPGPRAGPHRRHPGTAGVDGAPSPGASRPQSPRLTLIGPRGNPIRRIEMSRPGELVHVDIKKLGKIPKGGGWRAHGGGANTDHGEARPAVGYAYIHSAIDGYTRLAYSEVSTTSRESAPQASGDAREQFFSDHGINVERVLSDNGACYRSDEFAVALERARHSFTRPYRAQPNGKAETLQPHFDGEWAYVRTWTSEGQRTRRLATGCTSTTITDTTPPSEALQ